MGERESAAVRMRVRHADGHWLILEAHSRPLAAPAGRLSLSLEPVALAEVAAETVSLIRPLADQHHIVLTGPNSTARPTSSATASGSSRSC
jgi:hypothetical protein